jgi:hypothetical protein
VRFFEGVGKSADDGVGPVLEEDRPDVGRIASEYSIDIPVPIA